MNHITELFSIYIDVVMLCIGLYLAFVQGKNLVQVEQMEKEGSLVKIMGWVYIVVSIIGFIIFTVF